jgi:hypothetical protein
MKYKDILNSAVEIIKQRGWIQGAFNRESGVCLSRAINDAAAEHQATEIERWDARYAVLAVIGSYSIASWNDSGKRTKAQVLDALFEATKVPQTWTNHMRDPRTNWSFLNSPA